jgi:hypothetical protein
MIMFYELTDASLHVHDPLRFVMSEFVSHELELRQPSFVASFGANAFDT